MIQFDIPEGSTDAVGAKCYVSPKISIKKSSLEDYSTKIELVCDEVPTCPKDKPCPAPEDVETTILYEPVSFKF